MNMIQRIREARHLAAELKADESGTAIIESAFAMLFMSLLLLGFMDFGMAYTQKAALENAVRAGVQYVPVRRPITELDGEGNDDLTVAITDVNTNEVVGAINAAMPLYTHTSGSRTDPTVTVKFICNDDPDVEVDPGGCTDPDDDTLAVEEGWVIIQHQEPYTMLFPYPGLPQTVTLSVSARLRII